MKNLQLANKVLQEQYNRLVEKKNRLESEIELLKIAIEKLEQLVKELESRNQYTQQKIDLTVVAVTTMKGNLEVTQAQIAKYQEKNKQLLDAINSVVKAIDAENNKQVIIKNEIDAETQRILNEKAEREAAAANQNNT